jgi:hypothetical protein
MDTKTIRCSFRVEIALRMDDDATEADIKPELRHLERELHRLLQREYKADYLDMELMEHAEVSK